MHCSPILRLPRTWLPGRLRQWIGAQLSGPPAGPKIRRSRACLYAVGRLGDFVLVLSAVRRVLAEYGPENCTLVVAYATLPLAAREFPLARLIGLPTEASSLIREIIPAWWQERKKFVTDHFEQSICLSHQRTLYHEITLSWISAGQDIRLLPETYPTILTEGLSTDLLAHQQVVETVLGHPVSREEILPQFTTLHSSDNGRLLVYPLSRDPARCLSIRQVVEVLRLWRVRSRAPIVFGGSPADAIALEDYFACALRAKLDGLSVELPAGVDGFFNHIAQAGAVLTTETAAAHVATALDKPTVVLLGGGLQGLCYPWRRSTRQIQVQHPLPCFGCGWHCTQTEKFCLTQLSPAAAAAALPAL